MQDQTITELALIEEPKQYNPEEHKETVWLLKENVIVFHARISSLEFTNKAIEELKIQIGKEFDIDPSIFTAHEDNTVLTWKNDDSSDYFNHSQISVSETTEDGIKEYQISIAIKTK